MTHIRNAWCAFSQFPATFWKPYLAKCRQIGFGIQSPMTLQLFQDFSRSEERGEIFGPIIGRFVDDISLSIPLLAFWYSAMALPIVFVNEGKFFEPKKRMINTKAIMNHSAPAIFISIDEKTNYDLPSRFNDAILPYLDNPLFIV